MRLAIAAYRRRRGWAAWHIAVLSRYDNSAKFPSLEELMGVADAPGKAQSADAIADAIWLWGGI